MHRSPTSLLKRSPVMAQSMVMPSLVLPTSTSIEGRYLFTEFDQFSGLPTIPRQPIQSSWIEHPDRRIHVSPNTHYEPARKKRLTIGQIKSLECSFAVDNKLEPERKNMLARELGLQPRQVAIWYQNRRARTKSKNLEEKYDALHMQYQGVLDANKKLEAEVIKLRELLGLQEKVKLGANDAKTVVDKRQENNSALSTNQEEAHFSRMEGWQHQIYIEGKSNEQTVDSENINSCATTQNESTLNANSPPSTCTFNPANDTIKAHISQTQGMPLYAQQKEMCHFNHQVIANTIDDNQLHHHHHLQQLQQHQVITYTDDDNKLQHHHHQQQLPELLQHFQHHYYLSGCNNSVEDAKLDNFESIVLPSTSHAQFDGQFLDDYETASSILSLLLKPRESLTLLP